MLEGIKRWFAGGAAASGPERDALSAWAASRQYMFRGVREGEGFVVEGRFGAIPWRLESGPSQRSYIKGSELRLRAELGVQSDLQLVLLNRALQEQMEATVFDTYVEGVQTRIDNQTPPEMRWLVMFQKLGGAEMGPLRERFVALASIKNWLVQWLAGPMTAALGAVRLDPATPFVLMIGRGRLTLRMQLDDPQPRDLDTWIRLFETATREGRRVATQTVVEPMASTQPSMWSATSLPPEEPPK